MRRIGIVLIVLGVVIGLIGFLFFANQPCMCPNQPIGQPNTCNCGAADGLYFSLGIGAVISIVGIIVGLQPNLRSSKFLSQ